MSESLKLPEFFEPYRAQIEATVRPYIRITTSRDEQTGLLDSKFGGYPYLPVGTAYPKDKKGQDMALLAQINFAQMPHLDPYPGKGILQFYLPYGPDPDFLYGLGNGEDWRVLWFPEPDEKLAMTDFSFLPDDQSLQDWTPMTFASKQDWTPQTPAAKQLSITRGLALRLSYELTEHPVTTSDYHFKWMMQDGTDEYFFDRFGQQRGDTYGHYNDLFPPFEHRIGGYAGFMQLDPRAWDSTTREELKPDPVNPSLLLLQIASDDFFLWGDVGVGHFFIQQDDLIRRDFSHTSYSWDDG